MCRLLIRASPQYKQRDTSCTLSLWFRARAAPAKARSRLDWQLRRQPTATRSACLKPIRSELFRIGATAAPQPEPTVETVHDGYELTRRVPFLEQCGVTLTIIDTAGGWSDTATAAIGAADLCLIPVRPSPADIEAAAPTLAAIRERAKPFAFVLNQTPARSARLESAATSLSETAASLHLTGLLALPTIVLRNDQQDALGEGLAVTEYARGGKSADEISGLWQWVWSRLTSLTPRKPPCKPLPGRPTSRPNCAPPVREIAAAPQALIADRQRRARCLAIRGRRLGSQEIRDLLDHRQDVFVLFLRRGHRRHRRRFINGSDRMRLDLDRSQRLGPWRGFLRRREHGFAGRGDHSNGRCGMRAIDRLWLSRNRRRRQFHIDLMRRDIGLGRVARLSLDERRHGRYVDLARCDVDTRGWHRRWQERRALQLRPIFRRAAYSPPQGLRTVIACAKPQILSLWR